MRMKFLSKEVYVADDPVANLGRQDMEFLKTRVGESERRRTRLCAHKDTEGKLHEMFVVYERQTYIRPNRHSGKDESLHILEGEADFVFFDDEGNVTDVVPLGSYSSSRQFYCRIPQSVYHTFVIRSDVLVIHEATPGPFRRADTVFAPWAPEEQDAVGVAKFMEGLARAVTNLTASGG